MASRYSKPGACGVYEIYCTPSRRRYVGSSRNIEARWSRHKDDLKYGVHHSIPLQRAFNKYGPDAFEYRVVELCAAEDLTSREQAAVEKLKPAYNVVTDVTRAPAHTEAVRAKISATCRKVWTCPERRARQSAKAKLQHHNPDVMKARWEDAQWRAALLERRAVRKYEVFGRMWALKELAEEYGLHYGMLRDRVRAGWDLERAILTPRRDGGMKPAGAAA